MTYPSEMVEHVRSLHSAGLNQLQISRRTGVSRAAIQDWIVGPRYQRRGPGAHLGKRQGCFVCDDTVEISTGDYVYLLGLYLGDGYVNPLPRGVWRLRVTQGARYGRLIEECRDAMHAVSLNRVGVVAAPGCVDIYSAWKHWIHLFPQHGPGPKHTREIRFEPWQQRLVDDSPEKLIRALIHSDGCRSTNTIRRVRPGGASVYSYPRYQFTNASADIRRIFTDACDSLGIRWTQMNARNVAVSRRDDVEFLDTFVGPKS